MPLSRTLVLAAALLLTAPAALGSTADTTVATLSIPVGADLAQSARRVLDARFRLFPSQAAEAGLARDGTQLPSYTPEAVAALEAQMVAEIATLRALPWEQLTVDEQIDVRWLVASAEGIRRILAQRRWEHRAGEWIEPLAGALIGLATYHGDEPELQAALIAQVPAMVDEMRTLVVAPTARDVNTATEMIGGVQLMIAAQPQSPERDGAQAALQAYVEGLSAEGLPDFKVVGEEAYQAILRDVMLLPWDADGLLAVARKELERVEAEIAELEPQLERDPPPTRAEKAQAKALTKAGLLALYDDMVVEDLAALRTLDIITVPADLPAIKARETPEALIPLTGDGGSMNPPPLFGEQSVGWWNVEHFASDWSTERRLKSVLDARRHKTSGYGPYAVHEGVPGHHLQLAMVRANPDPVRTLLWDNATVEGWGLYAEGLFWEHGGLGPSKRAQINILRSYQFRIRRVIYDVHVATGRWTLQEAADWKEGTEGAEVSRDILRAIQWPTQLIGYFAGKAQIDALREEVRAQLGEAYSDRDFHDRFLAAGLVPIPLIRAKMLGTPVPRP